MRRLPRYDMLGTCRDMYILQHVSSTFQSDVVAELQQMYVHIASNDGLKCATYALAYPKFGQAEEILLNSAY